MRHVYGVTCHRSGDRIGSGFDEEQGLRAAGAPWSTMTYHVDLRPVRSTPNGLVAGGWHDRLASSETSAQRQGFERIRASRRSKPTTWVHMPRGFAAVDQVDTRKVARHPSIEPQPAAGKAPTVEPLGKQSLAFSSTGKHHPPHLSPFSPPVPAPFLGLGLENGSNLLESLHLTERKPR